MRTLTKFFFCLVICIGLVTSAFATSFIVKGIQINGLNGVSKETVLNYLPIGVGDRYTDAKSGRILDALYGSGFFTNVNLARSGNDLVIKVQQRPTIGSLEITGNKEIKTDQLKKMLKNANVSVGQVYNRGTLNEVQKFLKTQYYSEGYYNAKVEVKTTNLRRNRVTVRVLIHEGKVAKIQKIRIIGNQAFSESKLQDQMLVTTPGWFTWFTKTDHYSKQKFDASLEQLRSFYMNRGYIRFHINSQQVSLSKNREHVYIVVRITEGSQYHFSGYKFSGRLILPKKQLRDLVLFEKGDVFSQLKIEQTNQAVGFALGDHGYAFTRIEPIPEINDHTKQVFINFHVAPGKKVYVRNVIFQGNSITGDYVMRRVMKQMEGGLLSSRKIQQSIRQLNLLGFFKNVNVKTVPVPGKNNQVDLVYSLEESAAGQASVSLGYGTLGFQVGAGINQPNFLGTGKTVGINYSRNDYASTYSINYYNPFYTINNIGRGFTAYYTATSPGNLNLSQAYAFNTYGMTMYYHIPVTTNNSITTGFGLSHIELRTFGCSLGDAASGQCTLIPSEIQNFVNTEGNNFNMLTYNAAWNFLGIDRAIFPTQGYEQKVSGEVSMPVFANRLEYYKVGYGAQYFQPLNHAHSFILHFRGGIDYGNGYGNTNGLPFFMNYYAGGLAQGMNRGFEQNVLGPKDSNGDPIGGNFLAYGGAGLIFPNFISPDDLRTSVFVDAANVYQTDPSLSKFDSSQAKQMMYSAGLGVTWRSPLGPLDFSLALPLNKQAGDDTQLFHFTMGTSF